MKDIFIVGSKGIPGKYGGFETFVDKLTDYNSKNRNLRFHVACKGTENGEFTYNNARCFTIKVPDIGPQQAVYYDVMAMRQTLAYIREHRLKNPVIYILACRIGPFMKSFVDAAHALGAKVFVNPDGHEWLRSKWPWPVKKYWKYSEHKMVQHADLLVCDSVNIEKYIRKEYAAYHPHTTYISYGAERRPSSLKNDAPAFQNWLKKNGVEPKDYYLTVGRFVPENNFETMLREFMRSQTKRKLVVITTANDKFYRELQEKLHFEKDPRIVFAGTVYDQELLMKIREEAYAYIHGHEVGGTNPSLLESLSSTDLNLLYDVSFNREVAEEGAKYWTKKPGSLARLIEEADRYTPEQIQQLAEASSERIAHHFSWSYINQRYQEIFGS